MELDVKMGKESLAIPIADPYALDLDGIVKQIEGLIVAHGVGPDGLDLRSLLPKMVRGIAGCEGGCPANAREFVAGGFAKFDLTYIEGGILSAKAVVGGKELNLKMFPDF